MNCNQDFDHDMTAVTAPLDRTFSSASLKIWKGVPFHCAVGFVVHKRKQPNNRYEKGASKYRCQKSNSERLHIILINFAPQFQTEKTKYIEPVTTYVSSIRRELKQSWNFFNNASPHVPSGRTSFPLPFEPGNNAIPYVRLNNVKTLCNCRWWYSKKKWLSPRSFIRCTTESLNNDKSVLLYFRKSNSIRDGSHLFNNASAFPHPFSLPRS